MSTSAVRACHCCGLIQRVPPVPRGHRARCARCGTTVRRSSHPRATARAAALSLAALVLYPVAMALPVIELERLGHRSATTIWGGVSALADEGEWGVALVVLASSIVAPLVKIGAMFALCAGDALLRRRHRAWAYRGMELIGRWGMVDVLLVAILVAAVKLGSWVEAHPGPGLAAFAGVVVLSLLSSASFDPHAVWEDET